MATRKEQAEQTRKKILDAAQDIIREEGIHSLSSLKIVQRAGISKGSFFHHFPQIEDLYLYMLDQFVHSLDEGISPDRFNSFEEFMRTTTSFTISLLEDSPETISSIFYFLSQSTQKHDYQQKLKSYLDAVFKRWTNNMDHFFPPKMSEAKKDRIVRLIDMYFCGFSFHFLVLQNKALYMNVSEEFIEMISHALESE